jgi:hypothetical protein
MPAASETGPRILMMLPSGLNRITWMRRKLESPIEDPLGWLQAGAPADDFRMLGYDATEE